MVFKGQKKSAIATTMILLTSVAASGCLETGPEPPKDTGISIARIIAISIDQDTYQRDAAGSDDDILDRVMTTKYEISATGSAIDAATLQVTYTDKTGSIITKGLSESGSLTQLSPGAPISITGVDFAGGIIVRSGDKIVAERTGVPLKSWDIANVPLGFQAAPGSKLAYSIAGHGVFDMSINDYQIVDEDGGELSIETARESFDMRQTGTIELGVDSTAQTVQAETSHNAHAAPFKFTGRLDLEDFTLEAKGTHNQTPFDAGVQAKSGFLSGEMGGRLWLDGSKVVKAESSGGKLAADAEVIAWLTGITEEDAGTFQCFGKLKTDDCKLNEVEDNLPMDEAFEASSLDLDGPDESQDQDSINDLKKLLQADMGTGDALRVSIKVDATKDQDASADLPETLRGEFSYSIEVGKVVDVTTPAGTMKAWEVVEHSKLTMDISRYDKDDFHFKGLNIDQEPMTVKIYLAEKSFTPVKVVYDQPLDINQMVRQVVDAVEDSTWEALPGSIPKPKSYEFKVEGGQTMTLDKLEGDVGFQPWAGLVYAHMLQTISYGAMAATFASGYQELFPAFTGGSSDEVDETIDFVDANVLPSQWDADGNNLTDTLQFTLDAPSGTVFSSHETKIYVNGLLLDPTADIWLDLDGIEAWGSTPWVDGESIFAACTAGDNDVMVFIRGVTVLVATLECQEEL
ncbi:MAG: hypothetical protein HY556_08350 [Euryarchaeota archaeon]|nr:hypothetical protein [Euryarchaeota archaeon]